MSELGLMDGPRSSRRRGNGGGAGGGGGRGSRRAGGGGGSDRRRRRGKKKKSGFAVLIAFAVVMVMVVGGGYWAYGQVKDRFGPPPDYSGNGSSETVAVVVPDGSGTAVIGNVLKKAGVVKSVDAFTKAATADKEQRALKIQAGAYIMRKHMSAKAALDLLSDPKAKSEFVLTPGMRTTAVYDGLADKLKVSVDQVKAAAKDTTALGLPAWANGNLEGFLAPGSYPAAPGIAPVDVLKKMVKNATTNYTKWGVETRAEALKRKPYDLIIIASIIEAEGREADHLPKISDVIYNRLKQNMSLGMDSTLNYGLGKSVIGLTKAEMQTDTPYNTGLNKGLPPTPIGNPGKAAVEAAGNPPGDKWLYFVTVNPITGETKFAETLSQHSVYVRELQKWQAENPGH